jgi:hypothetical protein
MAAHFPAVLGETVTGRCFARHNEFSRRQCDVAHVRSSRAAKLRQGAGGLIPPRGRFPAGLGYKGTPRDRSNKPVQSAVYAVSRRDFRMPPFRRINALTLNVLKCLGSNPG